MEKKLKQEEYGTSVKLWGSPPSSSLEIASEDNPNKKNSEFCEDMSK